MSFKQNIEELIESNLKTYRDIANITDKLD